MGLWMQVQSREEFNDILQSACSIYKYVGRSQLRSLSRLFGVKAEEMQIVYLHRLLKGLKLPPLAVCVDMLEQELN